MDKNRENVQLNEAENELYQEKTRKAKRIKKVLIIGGIVLLIGIGVVWKCWDGKRLDLQKKSNDELKELRDKLQGVLLSPNSDQESKVDCIKWINVIDNITRARDPVDMKNYVFPKGGEHGTNLWKPD